MQIVQWQSEHSQMRKSGSHQLKSFFFRPKTHIFTFSSFLIKWSFLAGSLEEAYNFRVNLRSFGDPESEISNQNLGKSGTFWKRHSATFLLVVEPK